MFGLACDGVLFSFKQFYSALARPQQRQSALPLAAVRPFGGAQDKQAHGPEHCRRTYCRSTVAPILDSATSQ